MDKKKTKNEYGGLISILVTVMFILGLILWPSIVHETEKNCTKHEVCYKTICTVWSYNKIKVDIDSAQCEVKEMACVLP